MARMGLSTARTTVLLLVLVGGVWLAVGAGTPSPTAAERSGQTTVEQRVPALADDRQANTRIARGEGSDETSAWVDALASTDAERVEAAGVALRELIAKDSFSMDE